MAPTKANNSAARQHNVHFSPPKQANPFIVRDAIETPPLTDARHALRPGRALLSEQVTLERQRTSQRKAPRSRDVLSPKHAGISKSGHRTPLTSRSRNSKTSGHHRNTVTPAKHSTRRAHRRASKMQPEHPFNRLLKEALFAYQSGMAIDLHAKLNRAKSSLENQLDYISKNTSTLPSTVLAESAALLTPLGETRLQITLQDSAEVFEQPLSRRFEDFRKIVLKERKRLEGLWKRYGEVVGKIETVQRTVVPGANGTVLPGGAETPSYLQESQRIKQQYQAEREKLLSDFEVAAEKVRESVIGCETVWARKRKEQKANEEHLKRLMLQTYTAVDEDE